MHYIFRNISMSLIVVYLGFLKILPNIGFHKQDRITGLNLLWYPAENCRFTLSRIFTLLSVSVICFTTFEINPVSAGTLDQALISQLADFCRGLKHGEEAPQFGPQLDQVCAEPAVTPPAGITSSTGGNAGSTQTGNAFVRRVHRQREKDESANKGGSAGAEASTTLTEGLNVYFSGQGEVLNRKTSTFEGGYNSNIWGVTTGADYQFAPWMLGGVALNFNQWSGDFKGNGGNFQTDSYGPTVYASFYPLDGFFADVSFRYSAKNFEKSRFASFTDFGQLKTSSSPTSNSGGDQLESGALIGYDLSVKNFTIGPRLAVNYRDLSMNGYTEKGTSGLELRYLKDSINSLQTSVGIQVSAAFSTSFGVLIPQITGDWTHEYEFNQRSISVQFAQDLRPAPTTFSYQTDRPDRDFFHVGTGIVAVLPKGFQSYINFEALLGHSYLNNYVGTVGVRLGF
jgi:outer membrane autotransporter protein